MNDSPVSTLRTTALTNLQKESLSHLADLCCLKDSIHLSYPTKEEDGASCHYLAVDSDGILLAALALIPLDFCTSECIAFTHPEYRQRGLFSRLLSLALKECRDCDLLFPVSESCAPAMAVLNFLEAQPDHRELKMEQRLSDTLSVSLSYPSSFLCCPDHIRSENARWTLLLPEPDCLPVGCCLTSSVSPGCLCIHHVKIHPRMRGKGYGTALISQMLTILRASGIDRLLLQVSGDNTPAIALYKKTGFQITETLSYYLY